mmetsp:Transcript_13422/g.20995  ORF Transcript_13422/g.20995 Transcript_13422/m.20995 type:complete len:279 (-) Transcript_13422:101-937(-)
MDNFDFFNCLTKVYRLMGGGACGGYNVLELGFERSTTNQEAINVRALDKLGGVAALDRAAVENAGGSSNVRVHIRGEPGPDGGMHLLGLLRGGGHPGADGPHGLVGDDHAGPVLGLKGGLESSALVCQHHIVEFASLALLKGLTTAEHDLQAVVDGELGLGGHNLAGLTFHGSTLGVPGDAPVNTKFFQHLSGSFPCVSSIARMLGDVLGRNLNSRCHAILSCRKMQPSRRHNHLCIRRNICDFVQHGNPACDLLLGAIGLPVTTHKVLLHALVVVVH